MLADTQTPVGAALKLFEPERGDFLLESVEGGEIRGRYSLLGLAPDLVFRAEGDKAAINRDWAQDREAFAACGSDTLPALRELVAECRIEVPAELPPVLSCLVGYFGYETIALVEDLPRARSGELALPDMMFVRPTLILVFDTLTDMLFCVAPLWSNVESTVCEQIASVEHRIDAALERLMQPVPASPAGAEEPAQAVLTPQLEASQYKSMVLKAQDYIVAGDIFQVVLAQRFTCPFPHPPLELYRALCQVNPSPFLYFLDLPGFTVVGSSP